MALFNDKHYGEYYIVKNTWLVLEPLFDYKSARYFLCDYQTHNIIKKFTHQEDIKKFILEDIKDD